MRDWSGPWTWAFQFQDLGLSLFCKYYWVPTIFHVSGPQLFSFPVHLRNSTHTSVTKVHSSPDSHRRERGRVVWVLVWSKICGTVWQSNTGCLLFSPPPTPASYLRQACTKPNWATSASILSPFHIAHCYWCDFPKILFNVLSLIDHSFHFPPEIHCS